MAEVSHSLPRALVERLEQSRLRGTYRSLVPRTGIDFSSNDYLGLSTDGELQKKLAVVLDVPFGATASRLLRGETSHHALLEAALADYCGSEASLFFPSGYQCNLSVLSSLLQPGDSVYSDELNHASLIDGIRLSGATKRIFPHRDSSVLRKLLAEDAALPGTKWIVTESLFSMDGDFAPVAEILDLAEEFHALVIVDEAHATGILGKKGEGWAGQLGLRQRIFATLHTGGKALGVSGAWVSCSEAVREYLINFSRGFIFSTAPSPILARSVHVALERWQEVGSTV